MLATGGLWYDKRMMEIIFLFSLVIIAGAGWAIWRWHLKQVEEYVLDAARNLVVLKILVRKGIGKQEEGEEGPRDFRETISVAEQFFAGFAALHEESFKRRFFGQERISFEIIAKKNLITFYVAVPKALQGVLERQVYSFYPNASIEPSNDYKIFSRPVYVVGANFKLKKKYIYPLRTYQKLEGEPLNAITSAFTKIPEGSAAGLQIIISPIKDNWRDKSQAAAKAIQEGKPIEKAHWFWRGLQAVFSALRSSKEEDKIKEPVRLTPIQEETIKAIQEKSAKIGFAVQMRVIVVSEIALSDAQITLNNFYSALAQYSSPEGNGLVQKNALDKERFMIDYILRRFDKSQSSILNTAELASIYHFPNQYIDTPNIEWLTSITLAPPSNLPEEQEDTVVLGQSVFRGVKKDVRIRLNDRRRHIYAIGKTGVGKTTLFVNQIIQDIKAGRGVAYLDPNGDAIETILSYIPKERAEDVVLFDPGDIERPMGLNMLEWKRPEDRDFLVAEWLEIFYKLFDPGKTGIVGPQFEHWGRNASLSVMMRPEGGTLIDIPRMFTDDAFREETIKFVKDPVVLAFWEKQLAKTSDYHKSEMFNYFISKFGRFMTNDLMRNIIGQTKSSFDFREIMDNQKIFLINLSKGKIGETNSYLLGMIIVAKLQVAAFQRADIPEDDRVDFYLYVDEFQNFTTDTFKTILSEARKYRLNLNVTNQYIAQLPEEIRDAIIGNAGTLITFRIGADDAEFMGKEFDNVTAADITNLPFATTYIKLLIDGAPTKPFTMKTYPYPEGANLELAKAIKYLSRLKYGRDRAQVEAEFLQRSKTVPPSNAIPNVPPPREF